MLALIAGSGKLPAAVAAAQSSKPLVCILEGFHPDGLVSDIVFRLETLGTLLAELKERGIKDVCFAGAIRRPVIDPTAIDAATLPLIPVLQGALGQGDDGALRAVISVFEAEGFAVRGTAELAPALLPPTGVPSASEPTEVARADAARAAGIVHALSEADIGQGCVVHKGQALAIEGVFGTDWMLASLTARPDATGGLLFKAAKVGQDRRADLPTIGPDTVSAAARAGLDGIVIQAGGVMVLEQGDVLALCDQHNLFLWVREDSA